MKNNRKRIWRIIGVIALILIVVGGVGVALYLRPLPASPDAVAADQSTDTVTVSNLSDQIVFMPKTSPKAGLIYYPGALVDPVAYSIKMRMIADAGYAVYVVKMPLNLAILGLYRAKDIVSANPQIKAWAIGGHSLGGAMACSFVVGDSARLIKGLLFHAAYCDKSADISTRTDLVVTSVSASLDGLATPQKIEDTKKYSPASTTYVVIEGSNHAYFGDYGAQNGDNNAVISRDEATKQIVQASLDLLAKIAG